VTTAGELRDLHTGLRLAAGPLRERSVQARALAIEDACRRLLASEHAESRELRAALVRSTGLSAPVVEHGLQTTLREFSRDGLLALHASYSAEPKHEPGLAAVVLAGNVFSAAARPLLLPLLCGWPVLLKAASDDDVFPRALQRALAAVDGELGAACAVVTFGREEPALRDALLAGADLLSVYGDDETVAAFTAIRPAGTRLVAHGHGFGLGVLPASALASVELARMAAQALARDVAAYDQRGCLSPHAVLVQRGAACDARDFAALLADALDALEQPWPRGPLPAGAAATQLQWRGVAAVQGELHTRASCAVGYAEDAALRASPGHRNVAVHACADDAALRAQLAGVSVQLKALAVAGEAERAALAGAAPYLCAPGAMQEPPLAARLDGLHPCAGL
jgi:acyl-CoA reductase-like NAD-dependent aldehyde dehydrogenase